MVTPDEASAPPVVSARGVRVVLEGQRSGGLRRRQPARGLEDFAVDVRLGEVVHLVGESGSGVVEALEVLSGARAPQAGRLLIDGLDVTAGDRSAREVWRTRVATLGESPAQGTGRQKVLRAVAEGAHRGDRRGSRSAKEARRERAHELLDSVGIAPEARGLRLRDLTADQAARVGLAGLLARRPALVVVAPPGVPGVDVDLLSAVLERLRAESGTAVVQGSDRLPATLASHERVQVLCGGRTVEVLRAGDLAHPLHPWTRALQAGADLGAPRPDVADPGCPFRDRCDRAQGRCAERMPDLTRPLGASHPVACWFPEDPRPDRRPAATHLGGSGLPASTPRGHSDEPTAREFIEG